METIIDSTPTRYPANYAQEYKSVTTFLYLINKDYIITDPHILDKLPNTDGIIEIVNDAKFRVAKLEIQIKTLPDKDIKKPKFPCDIHFLKYCEESVLPVILIVVNESNQIVFWRHISRNFLMSIQKDIKGKSKVINFPKENKIIKENQDYIKKWIEIYKECQEKQFSEEESKNERYNEYINRWNKLSFSENLEELFENLNKVKEFEKYFRLPKRPIFRTYTNNTRYLIQKYIDEVFLEKEPDSIKIKFIDIINLILRNIFIPLSCTFEKEMILKLVENFKKIKYENLKKEEKEIWFEFVYQLIRNARFQNNKVVFDEWKIIVESKKDVSEYIKNSIYYEEILYNVINLNYKEAEDKVNSWNIIDKECNAEFLIKKAFLIVYLNLEDRNKAINLIEKARDFFSNAQEKLWVLEILHYYKFSFNLNKQLYIDKEINRLKSKGYYSLEDIKDSLLNSFDEKLDEVKPYESLRYEGTTFSLGLSKKDKDYFNSVRFTEFIFAFGIPLTINFKYYVSYINRKEWYLFYKNLINEQITTQTAFFLSLQYGGHEADEDYTRRITQDIVFSRHDKQIKKEIYNKLYLYFKYCLEEKKTFNKKILFVLAEFVPILEYDEWKELWTTIWDLYKKNEYNIKNLFYIKVWGISIPINKMLPYISNKSMISEIFEELFLFYDDDINKEQDILNDYIFFLILKKNKDEKYLITSKIENKINQIINKSLYDYDDLIKLYYLRNLLSENQKQNIIDKLIKEDFSNLKINNNFVLLLSYNFNNPELTNKIKKYILNSDFVFNTGISFDANGKMSRHNIIYFKIIDYINTNWKKIDVITWENEDIKIFYNKLKISLNLLKNNIDKNDPFTFINTRIVLEDMYLFLKNQESILKDELDYFEILTSVEKEFFEFCGYKDLKEALLSKDDTIQMLALNNFFIELRNNPTKELKEEWMLLIFKVLKQEEPRFEVALEYLAYLLFLWLKDQVWPKQYSNFYLMILKKNKENPIDEGDRIHNETCLVKIALALKNNWNINDPIIDEWLEYKKQSEFIDINEIDDVTKDKI